MTAAETTGTAGDQPEKMDLRSLDVAADRQAELLRLFPEVRTEGGKIDFDRLQRALGEMIDSGRERYGLTWPGKADCFRTIQAPSLGTLRPARDESVNFDTTENLIIEGDNLEVLKLLERSYLGKVKMIYIDPPYNTGNDFIYPDNFGENLKTYLQYTGQVDAEGRRFGSNTETDGRFHSKWLNMMYPRLYKARNLLREDGLIFVSVDDNEVMALRGLLNEIFGEENFCAVFVWNSEGNTDNQYLIKVKHEYVVAYYRNASNGDAAVGRIIDPNTREDSNLWKGLADNNINKNGPENPPSIVTLPVGFPCSDDKLNYAAKALDVDFFEITQREKYISDDVRARYGIEHKSGLPVKLDDLVVEEGRLVKPCRVFGGFANKNKLLQFIGNRCEPILDDGTPLKFYLNSNAAVRYQKANDRPRNIVSVLSNFGTTEKTKTALRKMGIPFDYPKPTGLIEYLIRIGCDVNDGIVLDFFGGSGTTADAVVSSNEDGGVKRKFIVVQLPEVLDLNEPTQKDAAKFCEHIGRPHNLAEITKERVRRVIKKLDAEDAGKLDLDGKGKQDRGFRVFKLAESNFLGWDGAAAKDGDTLGDLLEQTVDHVRQGRSDDDLLYELLLKSGFPLTTKVESKIIAGKTVHSIADGLMLVCLDRALTLECIRAMADLKPERVVCLDAGFANNDQLKTNAVLTFKSKGVVKFLTV